MKIGVPTEIKNNENRVAITPAGAHELTMNGHDVLLQSGAGIGSGFSDDEYSTTGARILPTAKAVFNAADIIYKVKEPLPAEYDLFREGQALFTYLHLAANAKVTRMLLAKKVTGIAYETVQTMDGALPLLIPMSEVAGRMSVQVGAMLLQKYYGGRGVLLGGVPGVMPAEVVIIGGGVVGTNAARMAIGLGARVTVLDINQRRLAELDDIFGGRVATVIANQYSVAKSVMMADLLIGAVLVIGAKAPKTVTEDMVKTMKSGAVIVDVAIDQGGTVETIDRITTHDNPSYEKHGVIHYSVANMPGAVPRTSTWALSGVTLPYMKELANKGIRGALIDDVVLRKGLNTMDGHVTCLAVSTSLHLPFVPSEDLLY